MAWPSLKIFAKAEVVLVAKAVEQTERDARGMIVMLEGFSKYKYKFFFI